MLKLLSAYNGNNKYSIDICQLREQEYIEFYGWKFISLSFPGNWYGETGVWELEDMYGERISISLTKQNRYATNRLQMIREATEGAKKFAENNLSVEYYNLVILLFLHLLS